MGIYKQDYLVRVSTLIVIREDLVKVFDTFVWSKGIKDVFTKFDEYCKPHIQIIYERYCFNNRKQVAGKSISVYMTKLHVIAKNCAHDEIKPDEIVHDEVLQEQITQFAQLCTYGPWSPR